MAGSAEDCEPYSMAQPDAEETEQPSASQADYLFKTFPSPTAQYIIDTQQNKDGMTPQYWAVASQKLQAGALSSLATHEGRQEFIRCMRTAYALLRNTLDKTVPGLCTKWPGLGPEKLKKLKVTVSFIYDDEGECNQHEWKMHEFKVSNDAFSMQDRTVQRRGLK